MEQFITRINQQLVSALLKETNPGLFKACEILASPLVRDYKHIPYIYQKIVDELGEVTMEHMPFIVSVLYRLYIPVQLFTKNNKKPIGMRDAFAQVLGYKNPENINQWGDILLAYYKGHRFAKRVDDLAFKIYDELKTNEEFMENIPETAPCPQPFENVEKVGFVTKNVIQLIERQNVHLAGVENALLF